jgi:hypothetical protein
MIGNGAGGFTQGTAINDGASFDPIAVSDFNNDGNDDVLLAAGTQAAPSG